MFLMVTDISEYVELRSVSSIIALIHFKKNILIIGNEYVKVFAPFDGVLICNVTKKERYHLCRN